MSYLKRHSLELQFWGYETGNIVAAIAGAGGFALLYHRLMEVWMDGGGPLGMLHMLFADFPEAAASLCVVAVVLFAFPFAALARWISGETGAELVHAAAIPLALAAMIYALMVEASPFTVAACAFVMTSCLLRHAGEFPLLLKPGGLFMLAGGLSLSVAGFTIPTSNAAEIGFAIATFVTGLYAAGSGLLVYRGGMAAIGALGVQQDGDNALERGLHPTRSISAKFLAATLDPLVSRACCSVVLPSIFWASDKVKAHHPLYLSMIARVPLRLIGIGFAFAIGTEIGYTFAIAYALWALGDFAIGSIDAPEPVPSLPGVVIR